MKPPDRQLGARRTWTLGRVAGLFVKTAIPVAILGAAAFGYNALVASKPEVPRRPAVERAWTVETRIAEPASFRPRIVAYGTLVAGRQVSLRALVAGEVVAVGSELREGGTVHAGDTLVEIDSFNYEGAVVEAKANLAEARARLAESETRLQMETTVLQSARDQLEIARRDEERAETLSGTGSMTAQALDTRRLTVIQRQQAVDAGEATLEINRAQIAQLKAQVDRLEWKVRQAERSLEDVVLTAPFDAYVGTVAAQVGKLLNVNDAIATLYDRNAFDVRFALTDAQYGRLLEEGLLDRPVEVRWNVGGTPRSFKASIVRVAPEIAAARGGVDVYARIEPSEDQGLLRPGAFVEILLDDKSYQAVVRVPATAIYGTDRLYVIEDGRLSGRQVEIVGYDGSEVLVRGDLTGGERIVTTRITEAGDGLKVNEQADEPAPPPSGEPTASRSADEAAASDG
ncbi:efflux RND transporter periplasmic adaptor subunit [Microbaculum marinum]|uniref:Efflux RND transporter periplasmic adaptor subunit n=1 Tax=Microbaculum marinum TaxID=1764581 RepID=A0AAW9RTZ1_9HYPH